MAPKPKSPSLRKVAKTYKKTHSQTKTEWSGARAFDTDANSQGAGKVKASKNLYKPKPASVTVGGTSKAGKGVTKRKIGRV